MLQYHVSRIREALQAVSAEKRKKRAARGGFARRGALGLPGAGHVVQSGVLCVGYSSTRILRNSLMGYAPVMQISLSWECDSITNLPIFYLQVCRYMVH